MNGPRERIRAATFVLRVTGSAATAGPGIPPGALPGSARAAAALERCAAADDAHGTARADLLQQALALAEEAVDADDADARAHFAVFCALGKQMATPVSASSTSASCDECTARSTGRSSWR